QDLDRRALAAEYPRRHLETRLEAIIRSMKVLDLECPQGHVFEGWFGSEDEFQGQLARALVACPLCGDTHVAKRLSAPRIHLGAQAPAQAKQDVMTTADPVLQAKWLQMVRHVLANTEDVGER